MLRLLYKVEEMNYSDPTTEVKRDWLEYKGALSKKPDVSESARPRGESERLELVYDKGEGISSSYC